VRWYRPRSYERSPGQPALLWLHGGGFFRGSPDLPEAHDVAESLANQGITTVTVSYRLAPPPGMPWLMSVAGRPRGRYPLPLDDVLAAFHEVNARSPHGVIVGGASAGACLAATAILRALDEGAQPSGAVLAYGFFHAKHPRPLAAQRSRGHRRITHAPWALDIANRNYAGSRGALVERLAFPGGHELHGFPRTLMLNAEQDNMRASGDRFAAELTESGTEVQRHVLPGTRHAFLNRPNAEAFGIATSLIAAWARHDPIDAPDAR
jgi:acetyl esterase